MATSNLQSLQITGLNGTPPVSYSTGEGAPGEVRRVDGFVTALSADAIGSTYRLVRLPSNVKIKKVTLNSAVATAGAGNIGLYYSNSTQDNTIPADQGAVINASYFAASDTLVSQVQADVTYTANGTNTFANVNTPLWSALAIGVGPNNLDPGGMIDVVITLTAAVTTGGVVGVSVEYVE